MRGGKITQKINFQNDYLKLVKLPYELSNPYLFSVTYFLIRNKKYVFS